MRPAHVSLLCAALAGTPCLAGEIEYKIIDLTEIAEPIGVEQCEARGINDHGQIVGFEALGDSIERAIHWDIDFTPSILAKLPDDNSNLAVEIENDGAIIGLSELVTFEKNGDIIIITEDQKAMLWQGNEMVNLNDLVEGGDTSFDLRFAWDGNDHGNIVGWGRPPDGPPFPPKGFRLDPDGIVTNLGLLNRPLAINELDQVVGYGGEGQDNAYLWETGTLTNLHEHDSITGVVSRAFDINDAGEIVGEAQFDISKPEEPAIWIDLAPQPLIPDVNRSQGVATAIMEDGTVLGFFNDLDDLETGFFGFTWKDGGRTILLDHVVNPDGWQQILPFDINERGQIVGGGTRNNELGHGFFMSPITTASLLNVEVAFGTPLEGGIEEITTSDDAFLRARSNRGFLASEPNLIELIVTAGADADSPGQFIDVTIESRIDHPEGTAKVRLRDWATDSFVGVDSYPIGPNQEMMLTELVPAAAFVRETDRQIEISIRHVVLAVFAAQGFTSEFDLVRVQTY